MLGDIISAIRNFYIRNIKCRHKYKYTVREIMFNHYETKECELCGRVKTKRIWYNYLTIVQSSLPIDNILKIWYNIIKGGDEYVKSNWPNQY